MEPGNFLSQIQDLPGEALFLIAIVGLACLFIGGIFGFYLYRLKSLRKRRQNRNRFARTPH